jgi:hypothetical protein
MIDTLIFNMSDISLNILQVLTQIILGKPYDMDAIITLM